MSNVSLPEKVIISENILFQEIGGECVLLNMDSEQYFGLDNVGAMLWQKLTENNNPAMAIPHILSAYDIDEQTLIRDLANLIQEMEKEKLITLG